MENLLNRLITKYEVAEQLECETDEPLTCKDLLPILVKMRDLMIENTYLKEFSPEESKECPTCELIAKEKYILVPAVYQHWRFQHPIELEFERCPTCGRKLSERPKIMYVPRGAEYPCCSNCIHSPEGPSNMVTRPGFVYCFLHATEVSESGDCNDYSYRSKYEFTNRSNAV